MTIGHALRRSLALAAGLLFSSSAAGADVVKHYVLDGVGNVRVVEDQAGGVVERHDYLPFGEECETGPCASNPDGPTPLRFTGKERDAETGLDYFGARYYAPKLARFTTLDPFYAWSENLVDPQRWNRYAYARNNPLAYVDPDGRAIETPWDALNVGIGLASFAANVAAGNVGGAVVDAVGIAYDATATAVPFLPGGAGTAIKAVRVADKAADAARFARNKQVGAAFEEVVVAQKRLDQTDVVRQLTIKTDTGVRTKLDVAGRDTSGKVRLTEAKSSETARLTRSQRKAFPEIAETGGTVAGKGKPGFPGGTRIPPTEVEICRPCKQP